MKKVFVLLLFMVSLFATEHLQAQEYKSSVGVRLGSPWSASYKFFISEPGAIELFANFRGRPVGSFSWARFGFGGAYQHHIDLEIDELPGLRAYVGAGATAYFWTYSNDNFFNEYSNLTFGVQGYGGLDYAFDDVPLNLSVDWVPTFFIGDGYVSGFGFGFGAVSVRYILSR